MKATLLRAILGLALLLAPVMGRAALPPYVHEQAKDDAGYHLQVEVTRLRLPDRPYGACELEAVARQVFRGRLTPGAAVRFSLFCLRADGNRGDAPIGGASVYQASSLEPGNVLELYLNREATGGYEVPHHALAWWIAAPTAQPLYPPQAEMQRRRNALRAALAGGPDRPPLFPRRDTVVTYRFSARPGEEFRARYAPGAGEFGAVRYEVVNARAEAIVARPGPSPRQSRVDDAARGFRPVPIRPTDRFGLLSRSPEARFAREAEDQVAGQACTVWRIEEPDGSPPERACVTATGVMLRRASPEGLMEALRVEEAPQDPRLFDTTPAGYEFRGVAR